jgi:3-oxoacyl-[acyl-carrier protein] reductase
MDLGLHGKWALVCGASKGLGFGCAQALAQEGVNLVVAARGFEQLHASASQLIAVQRHFMLTLGQKDVETLQVLPIQADVTTPEGRAAVLAVRKDFDIVITNAGGPPPGDFRDWDRDAWLKAIDANMLAPIELIRATVDGMKARGFGRIVNITSSAVKSPIDILGLSNGARSGLTGFVAGVARSGLAAHNVTINNILPGTFDTDRIASNFAAQAARSGKSAQEVKAARLAEHPAGRLGSPAEFGALCAFVCSQHAGYINGQNLLMDGGSYPGVF